MHKIYTFTTAHGRPEITRTHLKWLRWFTQLYNQTERVQITPVYVLSMGDRYKAEYARAIEMMGGIYTANGKKLLSSKSQAGMDEIAGHDWDYVMHLDSDEFITSYMMEQWIKLMDNGTPWFGASDQVFYMPKDNELIYFPGYNRHPLVNGGTCFAKEVLKKTDGKVWTLGKDSGLNRNQYLRFLDAGYKPIIKGFGYRGSLEIKIPKYRQIHPLSWYRERGYPLGPLGQRTRHKWHIHHHNFFREKTLEIYS